MPKFLVEYAIRGTYTEMIEADSQEAAEAIADANAENDDWFPDLDEISDVHSHVQKLVRVRRKDGTVSLVTYVRDTDEVLPDAE